MITAVRQMAVMLVLSVRKRIAAVSPMQKTSVSAGDDTKGAACQSPNCIGKTKTFCGIRISVKIQRSS